MTTGFVLFCETLQTALLPAFCVVDFPNQTRSLDTVFFRAYFASHIQINRLRLNVSLD